MPLYPYQRTGARWLASLGASTRRAGMLADGMGLGKSAQSVAAADLLDAETITVVCPAIMVAEWCATFVRFGDMPREVLLAGPRGLGAARKGVLVTSYDRAQRDDVAAYIRERGGVIVFDECHFLKDPGSQRTARLLFSGLADRAERVICLTGTPVPNHAGELYPFMRLTGLATGSYHDFLQRYCVTRETEHGFQVLAHRNVDELRQMLGRTMLRRMHQVALPPTTFDEWRVDPAECHATGWRDVDPATAARARRLIESGATGGEAATVRRLVGVAKAAPVARRIMRVLEYRNNKAVVFCLHTDPIGIIARDLASYGVVILSGDTPEKKRKVLVDRFQSDPQTRVAVCQIKAAGVGVTLTAANHLVMCERPWSPADEEQALHRIIRIGQTRPTFVHRATLGGSIDEAVNRVLLRKSRLISEIIFPA